MRKIKNTICDIKETIALTRENYWANVFHDSIKGCCFFDENTSLSLGRFAIGYPGMYALFRILRDVHPKNILELGLGQTTTMIGSYVNYYNENKDEGIKHVLVEHNQKWLDTWLSKHSLRHSHIHRLDMVDTFYEGATVKVYNNFKENVLSENIKYDLVVVDAPYGSDIYSRIDILSIIDTGLSDSFNILMDDTNRKGEKNTVMRILEQLDKKMISYRWKEFKGEDNTIIIASEDRKYTVTI